MPDTPREPSRGQEAWRQLAEPLAPFDRALLERAVERGLLPPDRVGSALDGWRGASHWPLILYLVDRGFVPDGDADRLLEDLSAEFRQRLDSGFEAAKTGRRARAIEEYTRAIEFRPESKEARLARSSSLSAIGQHRLALADVDAALERDPRDASAWHQRGLLCLALGAVRNALEDLTRSLELGSGAACHSDLGIARQIAGDLPGAIEAHRAAVAAEPTNPRFRARYGAALAAQGDPGRALNEYEAACELAGSDPAYSTTLSRRVGALRRRLGVDPSPTEPVGKTDGGGGAGARQNWPAPGSSRAPAVGPPRGEGPRGPLPRFVCPGARSPSASRA